jgi:hypothetical protein
MVVTKAASNDPVSGEIVGHAASFHQVRVRLETGQEVVAALPNLRKFGCLFGTLVGWKARVRFYEPPKMPRIIDLERPTQTQGNLQEK